MFRRKSILDRSVIAVVLQPIDAAPNRIQKPAGKRRNVVLNGAPVFPSVNLNAESMPDKNCLVIDFCIFDGNELKPTFCLWVIIEPQLFKLFPVLDLAIVQIFLIIAKVLYWSALCAKPQFTASVFAIRFNLPNQTEDLFDVFIVRKFGARAFHVGEVIFDSFVVRLQPLRHSSIESITHFCSRIIRRKMADYVILDIINGVQVNEVDHHRVMEIVNVDAVSQVTSVSNARNDVFLMRRQVFLERRLHIDGKLPLEGFYRSKK